MAGRAVGRLPRSISLSVSVSVSVSVNLEKISLSVSVGFNGVNMWTIKIGVNM